MAFKSLCVLPLLALVHAEPAGKAYDEWWRRYLKICEPGGLDKVLELIEPDAVGVVATGPQVEHVNLREYFEGYRDSIESSASFDATTDVLKVSGPTVTAAFSMFGTFKNGCSYTGKGFYGMDFNEAGKITYTVSLWEGLDAFMACYKEGKELPVGDVVPSSKMPPGIDKVHEVGNTMAEEGGMDRFIALLKPDGMMHITMGEKVQEATFPKFFGAFTPVMSKLLAWKSHPMPLMKTENALFQTVVNVGVFKDGCQADFGCYWFVAVDDEGTPTYMWEHCDDVSPFVECGSTELAVAPQALGSTASVVLTALVGTVLGAILSLAAMVALFGAWWRSPAKSSTHPLLQEPRGA